MGFEYIYAYLENLQTIFVVGTVISGVAVAALIIGRIINEIDRDDWFLMMGTALVVLSLFVIVDLSPSMEHIQKVRIMVTQPDREEKNETFIGVPLYPNAVCINSLMCSGR